jgi:RHS repeat-associated protein
MTYPSGGRSITYNYASGLDDTISRLTSITDGATTLESLSYLGLDTVVKRAHPQPGVDLTYIKQSGESNGDAGDQYTGLDRFGRVVDQRWILTSNGTALDRFQYGYDRDSNVLYKNNLMNSGFSELYHANGAGNGYDQLNQLTNFARGTLNGGNDTISSPTHSQSFSLDALGNWSSVTTDGSTQTRTANQQNEITSISSQTTPTYDANGNMTGDQTGHTLIFDAWNRLVQVKNGQTVLETYGYDALGRRVTESPGTLRDLYYDRAWQLLEEDVAGSMADQYVWSPVYIDALIERDTPTQRLYVFQDANFNVTALVDTSGTVQERYLQDPFGSFTVLAANWTTRGTSNYGWVFFFQGKRYDFATGLFASRERDYSPTLGRFLENDPLRFGARDSNFYRVTANAPTTYVDPSGLDHVLPRPWDDENVPDPPPSDEPYLAVYSPVNNWTSWYYEDGTIVSVPENPDWPVYVRPPKGPAYWVYPDGLIMVPGAHFDDDHLVILPDGSMFFTPPAWKRPPKPQPPIVPDPGEGHMGMPFWEDPIWYWAGLPGLFNLFSFFTQKCFPADTLVATEAGLRPISQVESSERVWSYDFDAGTWRLAEVECRHDSKYEGLLVTLDVGVGEVTATAWHPFWVIEGEDLESRPPLRHVDVNEDRGQSLPGRWINSHDLREGDVVFLRATGPVRLQRVWIHGEETTVCNLTIRGLHTFAVGESQLLVHNMTGTPNAGDIKKIPNSLMDKMGGEAAAAEIKGGIPGNPDLFYDPGTGTIYYPRPGGGFTDTGFNICDFLHK